MDIPTKKICINSVLSGNYIKMAMFINFAFALVSIVSIAESANIDVKQIGTDDTGYVTGIGIGIGTGSGSLEGICFTLKNTLLSKKSVM